MVTSRYGLNSLERMLLYRSIFSREESSRRMRRKVPPEGISGEKLAIDGFNVVSTVQSSLIGDILVRGTDSFIRDLSAYVRKVRVSSTLISALTITAMYLRSLEPGEVTVVYDSQVSKSLTMSRMTARLLDRLGIRGKSMVVRKADSLLLNLHGWIIASSDSLILEKASGAFDLGGRIAVAVRPEKIIDMSILPSSSATAFKSKKL